MRVPHGQDRQTLPPGLVPNPGLGGEQETKPKRQTGSHGNRKQPSMTLSIRHDPPSRLLFLRMRRPALTSNSGIEALGGITFRAVFVPPCLSGRRKL